MAIWASPRLKTHMQKKADRGTPSNGVTTLDWPALRPLVPTADLSPEVLVEGQIVVIRNLLTSTLCSRYVSFLSSLPLITTPGPKKGEAVRVNDRFQIQDAGFAHHLWMDTGLHDLITQSGGWGGVPCGLNPNIRIYRYRKGQFFDQHYDEANAVMAGSPPLPARTTWTLLIYLTGAATGCVGGETVFYPEPRARKAGRVDPLAIAPEVGMALLHKHGQDCMLHEGKLVEGGEKWVIRSDLCVPL
ncbi:hypothetical protein BZG36_03381 [Bifiguratus adelaidae]|uniref:Prolyl 4-hydroxylase alpha subunit domain-containing protein n=1 Tax=Bifiguratus adelaidae TaxID=1938954 RepID=A0A261Y0G6_9FUNG|nr:hypothetical protein BZG36_03381 [Bifiguratus adelaidae]